MRIAAIVLGIVGGAIGFLGGLFTIFFGGLGAALEAEGADTVISLGMVAIWVSLFALIVSCFLNKKPRLISLIIIIAGIVCIVCANYFSGIVIAVGGIFGLLSGNKAKA
jgi:glucan phosphoethanolaminetransferase (alkaline phosphatase superfamily)